VPAELRIGGTAVGKGQRQTLHLPLPRLYTHTEMTLPVQVVRGRRSGPRLLVCAALHGDELNGVEVIRRVVEKLEPVQLRGDLIAIPIVNVYGFINQSRYLPDRRDLNRSFPGSATGSLAARLAHVLVTEILDGCTHCIDLHTGSLNRTNLPQVRGDLTDDETRRCARAFSAPAILHASARDGSLREAASRLGLHVLVYEGGEPLRFDAAAIEAGVRGVHGVMHALGMRKSGGRGRGKPVEIASSTWVRARQSGIFHLAKALGDRVRKGEGLGMICDVLGESRATVRAPDAGIIIGHTNNPLVHRGDALIHLGREQG